MDKVLHVQLRMCYHPPGLLAERPWHRFLSHLTLPEQPLVRHSVQPAVPKDPTRRPSTEDIELATKGTTTKRMALTHQ